MATTHTKTNDVKEEPTNNEIEAVLENDPNHPTEDIVVSTNRFIEKTFSRIPDQAVKDDLFTTYETWKNGENLLETSRMLVYTLAALYKDESVKFRANLQPLQDRVEEMCKIVSRWQNIPTSPAN